ncbi:MAG: aldo/keto reductase [Caulobacteraceae bacterium]
MSRLCLGTMTFGLQCDEATSFAIMDKASEGGIDFFDTADAYPLGGNFETAGRTEEIIGRWLKGKRQDYVIATKCFVPMGPRPFQGGNSRRHILDAVEASLRRLGTDFIDLYQLHGVDPSTPVDETLEALNALVVSGKVRYVGCSNHLAYQVARALGRSEARGSFQVRVGAAALQPAVPGDRARAPAALQRGRPRRDPLQPDGRGHAVGQARPHQAAAGGHPASTSRATPASCTASATGRTRCSTRWTRSRPSPTRRAFPCRPWPSPGCWPQAAITRRLSSAPAAPTSWTPTLKAAETTLPADLLARLDELTPPLPPGRLPALTGPSAILPSPA